MGIPEVTKVWEQHTNNRNKTIKKLYFIFKICYLLGCIGFNWQEQIIILCQVERIIYTTNSTKISHNTTIKYLKNILESVKKKNAVYNIL